MTLSLSSFVFPCVPFFLLTSLEFYLVLKCFNEGLLCNFLLAWISSQPPELKEGLFLCVSVYFYTDIFNMFYIFFAFSIILFGIQNSCIISQPDREGHVMHNYEIFPLLLSAIWTYAGYLIKVGLLKICKLVD